MLPHLIYPSPKRNMPAIAGMFLVLEEGLVSSDCWATVLPFFRPRLFATPLGSLFLGFPFGWPFLRFTLGFLLSLTLSWPFLRFSLGLLLGLTLGFLLSLTLCLTLGLFLGLLLSLAFGLLLGLTLGLTLRLLLSLALGLFLDLTLRLTFGFLFRLTLSSFFLRLTLSCFFLRLTFACFSLRSAAFSDLSLRLLTSYFPLLRDLSLRSFLTRFFLGSHIYLRVGYPALSIYNGF